MSRVPGPACWLHDDIDVRDSPIQGRGLFARRDLPEGEVVARLGGVLVSHAELDAMFAAAARHPGHPYIDTITVDEDVHLVFPAGEAVHFGNHSCDPNLLHIDAFTLAARRAISADDEITIDYGTQTGNAAFQMACACQSGLCRGVVGGDDWRLPALQERYGEHWVPALVKRIGPP